VLLRSKVLVIAGLLSAILVSVAAGTLSSYTVSTGGQVGIVPDSRRIREQCEVRMQQKEDNQDRQEKATSTKK
jgi:hypothetical protein